MLNSKLTKNKFTIIRKRIKYKFYNNFRIKLRKKKKNSNNETGKKTYPKSITA